MQSNFAFQSYMNALGRKEPCGMLISFQNSIANFVFQSYISQ